MTIAITHTQPVLTPEVGDTVTLPDGNHTVGAPTQRALVRRIDDTTIYMSSGFLAGDAVDIEWSLEGASDLKVDSLDRAYREDSAYERACRDAIVKLAKVRDMAARRHRGQTAQETVALIERLADDAAGIVRAWN